MPSLLAAVHAGVLPWFIYSSTGGNSEPNFAKRLKNYSPEINVPVHATLVPARVKAHQLRCTDSDKYHPRLIPGIQFCGMRYVSICMYVIVVDQTAQSLSERRLNNEDSCIVDKISRTELNTYVVFVPKNVSESVVGRVDRCPAYFLWDWRTFRSVGYRC